MMAARPINDLRQLRGKLWHEVFPEDAEDQRAPYQTILAKLESAGGPELRRLEDRLEATMREMGVTFDIARQNPWGRKPWHCDILPQIFSAAEWQGLDDAVRQRMEVSEMFLRDIYGRKEILRSNTLPVQVVLNSPYYQREAGGLPLPDGAFLHLSGLSFGRRPDGRMVMKYPYFSNASGISYMMQNRRALSRVMPGFFDSFSMHSIIDTPTRILEMLRSFSTASEPTVVLLSPGQGSPAYSEHSFLGRRMGIPVVQGQDLLVMKDAVFLKTIDGLERVHVIYSRLADPWLDPLVFDPTSRLGVPGLVNCIRQGTVVVVNAIGSQLADDRSLMSFDEQIFRFYTGRPPLVPALETFWLGDLDQREWVLSDLENFTIRPVYGEKIFSPPVGQTWTAHRKRQFMKELAAKPWSLVAQPRESDALTQGFDRGKPVELFQDHILFALREGEARWQVVPGALTRISTQQAPYVASELGGGSKDTWVGIGNLASPQLPDTRRISEPPPPAHHVMSRVADSFYWTGRYLERAFSLAGMISTIESLELEELNQTERALYRPVWNRILPPLENREVAARRNISSVEGRHHLALNASEPGSVASSVMKAAANAESISECLSLEAWSVLENLRRKFQRSKFLPVGQPEQMAAVTRRNCEETARLVPQFFGVAESTMLLDGGWKFCVMGQAMERACITANALRSITLALGGKANESSFEIQLSAFLRMLGSRDAYRRVYQMRIELGEVLELLWMHPHVPRSVRACLKKCADLLREGEDASMAAAGKTLQATEAVLNEIGQCGWRRLGESGRPGDLLELEIMTKKLADRVFRLHALVSDGFFNHQIQMQPEEQRELTLHCEPGQPTAGTSRPGSN